MVLQATQHQRLHQRVPLRTLKQWSRLTAGALVSWYTKSCTRGFHTLNSPRGLIRTARLSTMRYLLIWEGDLDGTSLKQWRQKHWSRSYWWSTSGKWSVWAPKTFSRTSGWMHGSIVRQRDPTCLTSSTPKTWSPMELDPPAGGGWTYRPHRQPYELTCLFPWLRAIHCKGLLHNYQL